MNLIQRALYKAFFTPPFSRDDWIQTSRGTAYYPLAPRVDEVDIRDIATGLSKACRFNGHCEGFYSVAEHAVWVSYAVPQQYAWDALHHDDTEAYLADVTRPVKHRLLGYKEIEHRNWLVIAEKFGCCPRIPKVVKDADDAVLLAEQAQIMKPPPMPWSIPGSPAPVPIHRLGHEEARAFYLARFVELGGVIPS